MTIRSLYHDRLFNRKLRVKTLVEQSKMKHFNILCYIDKGSNHYYSMRLLINRRYILFDCLQRGIESLVNIKALFKK